MNFYPNTQYRYSMKEGMSGWDVQTIQIAFNSTPGKYKLVEDGIFGELTSNAARTIQHNLGITVDGIVGPQTQSSLCARECNNVKHLVPEGLLKGICFGESGGIIPTTSSEYTNHSRDYGPFQINMLNPNQSSLREAYNVSSKAKIVAAKLQSVFALFSNKLDVKKAWEMSVLNYNWPAAAQEIANGNKYSWVYASEGKFYKLIDPAPWIIKYDIPGVTTGLQWAEYYISKKIVYVKDWIV